LQGFGVTNAAPLEGFKAERINCNGHGTGLKLQDFTSAEVNESYLQNGGVGFGCDKTGSNFNTVLRLRRSWLRGNVTAGAQIFNVLNSLCDQAIFEGSGANTPTGVSISGGLAHKLLMCWWEGVLQGGAFSSCGSVHMDGGYINGQLLTSAGFYAFGTTLILDGAWGYSNLTQAFAQADTGAKIIVRSYDLQGVTFSTVNGGYVMWEISKAVALTDAATVTVNASAGNYFTLTGTTGRTIAAPTNAGDGQEITFELENTSGGSITHTFASGAGAYRSAGTVAVGASKIRTVRFRYSSARTAWIEVTRASADL